MRKKLTQKIKLDRDFCHEKNLLSKLSSEKNDALKFKKEGKIYRGSSAVVESRSTLVGKSDLVYRGVSENTTYYQLSKIRSSHRKRKLFYYGLEIFGQKKYLY